MKVLVTGGAGYIGSHTCVELLNAGHDVVVVDNLSNSSAESLRRVEQITGRAVKLEMVDIRNKSALDLIFSEEHFDAVIHFAGLKAVGESVSQPLRYYQNNVEGTLTLCEVMAKYQVFNLVFSSSATVYGDPHTVPITESFPLSATNPYGRSKLMVEDILRDLGKADQRWNLILLRYFNPIGAHPSGRIGEDPRGIPNNLLPYVAQVAVGRHAKLRVFGNDYPTVDGTGVRDYIHVTDLAEGHVAALRFLEAGSESVVANLGTGRGTSVLELVAAFERASGRSIPVEFAPRRAGDVAACVAAPALAAARLGWKASLGVDAMCADAWRWQEANPDGYPE